MTPTINQNDSVVSQNSRHFILDLNFFAMNKYVKDFGYTIDESLLANFSQGMNTPTHVRSSSKA